MFPDVGKIIDLGSLTWDNFVCSQTGIPFTDKLYSMGLTPMFGMVGE